MTHISANAYDNLMSKGIYRQKGTGNYSADSIKSDGEFMACNHRETIADLFIYIVLMSLASMIFGCDSSRPTVDLNKKSSQVITDKKVTGGTVRIAVGAMITPKEGFTYYREFLDYISNKISRPVTFIDRESYSEINSMLRTGDLDVAFVCSGPYVDGVKEFGLKPLVSPQAYGESVYYSYVIVPVDSPAKSFIDLKGKKFAFTDPQSNTGTLVPIYMLAKINETPDTFFKGYEYTYAHDKSIQAVALKLVDGAAVDSLIWEYAHNTNPVYTSKTKIIHKSPPYGIPPVVVRSKMDKDLVAKLRSAFLNAHKDPEGKRILAGMMIEKFNPLDDNLYNSVREMKDWLAKK